MWTIYIGSWSVNAEHHDIVSICEPLIASMSAQYRYIHKVNCTALVLVIKLWGHIHWYNLHFPMIASKAVCEWHSLQRGYTILLSSRCLVVCSLVLRVCLDLKQGWLYPCQARVGVWYKRKKLASDGKLGTNGRKKLAHDGEPNWLACESKKRCAREKKLATATPNVLYSVQVVASKHWASLLWAITHTG